MALKIRGNFAPNSFSGTTLTSIQTDFGQLYTRYTNALPATMSTDLRVYNGKAVALGSNRQFSTTTDLITWSATKQTPVVGTSFNTLFVGEFDTAGVLKVAANGSNSSSTRPTLLTTSNVFDAVPTWQITISSPSGGSTNAGDISVLKFNSSTNTWFGIGNKFNTSGRYYLNTSGTALASCSGSSAGLACLISYGSNFISYQGGSPISYRIFNGASPSYTCALGTVSNVSMPALTANGVAVNGTRVVAVADKVFAFSDNGTSFTLASIPTLTGNYRNISYGNGVFIATSQANDASGTPLYSVDNGESWNFLPDWDNGLSLFVQYDPVTQNFVSTNNSNRDVVLFNSNAIKNL